MQYPYLNPELNAIAEKWLMDKVVYGSATLDESELGKAILKEFEMRMQKIKRPPPLP